MYIHVCTGKMSNKICHVWRRKKHVRNHRASIRSHREDMEGAKSYFVHTHKVGWFQTPSSDLDFAPNLTSVRSCRSPRDELARSSYFRIFLPSCSSTCLSSWAPKTWPEVPPAIDAPPNIWLPVHQNRLKTSRELRKSSTWNLGL